MRTWALSRFYAVPWLIACVALWGCHQGAAERDQPTVRAAAPLTGELERYGRWVERTLRSHGGDSARAEVLFSPLRLDSDVLGAVVEVGRSARRYRLRLEEDSPPPEVGWTQLRGEGARALAGQRGSCPTQQAEQPERVPCLWLRLDARDEDPVLGFRLWLAYRLDGS